MENQKISKEAKWTLAAIAIGALVTVGVEVARTTPVTQTVVQRQYIVVTPTASPSATPVFLRKAATVAPVKATTGAATKK